MEDDRQSATRIKPVPGVTWRSHLGCGALFGFFAGFLGALKEVDAKGFLGPVLVGVVTAVLAGGLAALLGNRFWLR